jgi:ATP-dependent Clp protease ATP-binding subunit ClpA
MVVSRNSVAEVISQWTGIPLQKLSEAGRQSLLSLESDLARRIVGQDEAIRRVARRIQRASVGLNERRRPVGIFLFVGGTGVGKTELARAMGDVLFDSDGRVIRLDMTEFQEPHSVSKLIGAPPGYVGYEKEGLLTGNLRKHPYSLVLMDEIDKAHPDVLNVLLQVFEDGRLTDSKGVLISCTEAVFVMTANRRAPSRRPGFDFTDTRELEVDSVLAALHKDFRPEFLNRIDEIIVFRQLDRTDAIEIVRRRVGGLGKQLMERQGMVMRFDDDVIRFIAEAGRCESAGARELGRLIEALIEGPISDQILSGKLRERDQVVVQVGGDRLLFQTTSDTE